MQSTIITSQEARAKEGGTYSGSAADPDLAAVVQRLIKEGPQMAALDPSILLVEPPPQATCLAHIHLISDKAHSLICLKSLDLQVSFEEGQGGGDQAAIGTNVAAWLCFER